MRKFIFSFLVMLPVLSFTLSVHVLAAGSSNQQTITTDNHTAQKEAEGKEIWEKLQAKQLGCKNLTDEQYGSLGEYFMGQSIGNTQRHALLNQMMTNMMGEEGEEQMHVAMGKRLSGCEPNAQVPSSGVGFMPMMFLLRQGFGGQGMMGSAFAPWSFGLRLDEIGLRPDKVGGTKGGGNPMMGSFGTNPMGSFGWGFGWIFMILFSGLVILGIAALVKWIANQGKSQTQEKSALDILKERYAKGEIDKKEFEQMKKDLV